MSSVKAEINLNGIAYNQSNLRIPWKGKTFNQITSKIQMNTSNGYPTTGTQNYMRALPLNIYRREIVTGSNVQCHSRASSSIDIFDMPNGTIVNSKRDNNTNGLVNTIDCVLPNNSCEEPGTCSPFLSPSDNARRRVRSSGMIKKKFNPTRNNDTYYTNSSQYLVSRNRTFQQNQYNFIRDGNATVLPGSSLSNGNVYSANGISHCTKYHIVSDVSFQYQWLDTNFYTVDISSGSYAIDDITSVFNLAMVKKYHYYINNANKTKVFLMNFAYNSAYQKIEMHTLEANNVIFNTSEYSQPLDPSANPLSDRTPMYIKTWQTPSVVNSAIPVIKIHNNLFQTAIGFYAGEYPNSEITGTNMNLQTIAFRDNVFLSAFTPGIQPAFIPVIYKPSNPQFATQGGVSSSDLTSRVRYNTITNNTAMYRNAYGQAVANALAYGVPANGYTIKDKIGYPLRSTPKFSKYSPKVECLTCNTWDTQATTKSS